MRGSVVDDAAHKCIGHRPEALYCCLSCMKNNMLTELTLMITVDVSLIVSDYLFHPFPVETVLKTSYDPLVGHFQLYITAVDNKNYIYHLGVREETSRNWQRELFPSLAIPSQKCIPFSTLHTGD